jgi:SpoVK/Ycf46/Vps4 family AAA+-type ATPase
VNIPLSRIKTNQQLMDLIYDGQYDVGADVPVKLGLKDVIFVLEDIDCASRIVHSRKKKANNNGLERSSSTGSNAAAPEEKNPESLLAQASAEELRKTLTALLAQQQKQQLQQAASDAPQQQPELIRTLGFGSFGLRGEEDPDALNLSGILNVIDGVVDSPGRIIIITTNQPEKLDEALIRPGRIDQVIHLGYITYEQVVEMLNHYYVSCPLSSSSLVEVGEDGEESSSASSDSTHEDADLKKKVASISLSLLSRLKKCMDDVIPRTPAEIECMCAECETIEEFVERLEQDKGTSRSQFVKW